jgi:hypothetical protein
MALAPEADIVAITQRVVVETSNIPEAVIIAASWNGTSMLYLVAPMARDETTGRPEWISEGDITRAYAK